MAEDIDPPIIISGGGDGGGGGGGGGGTLKPGKKTKNIVMVDCYPEDPKGPKRFRTKINKDAEIKSVTIDFPGMANQDPIDISGYEIYTVRITFNTASASTRKKSKKTATPRKGTKASTKHPAASKKST